jgi:hypothetical protein
MDEQLKSLENNIITLSTEFVELKGLIAASFVKIDRNFTIVTSKLSPLERKLNDLTFTVNNLDGNTAKGFGEVGGKLDLLTEEIQKISLVTK